MDTDRDLRKRLNENLRDSEVLAYENAARGIEFLLTDVEVCLCFAEIALQSRDDPQKRKRNAENARRGFASVMHFRNRLDRTRVNYSVLEELEEKLARLRSKLETLGQTWSNPPKAQSHRQKIGLHSSK